MVGYAKINTRTQGNIMDDIGYSSNLPMSKLENAVRLEFHLRTADLKCVGIIGPEVEEEMSPLETSEEGIVCNTDQLENRMDK